MRHLPFIAGMMLSCSLAAQVRFAPMEPYLKNLEVLDQGLVDIDQDGDPDWVYTVEASTPPYTTVWWRANDGTGSFAAPVRLAKGIRGPWTWEWTDLDGDGDPDLLVGAADGADWYENLGTILGPAQTLLPSMYLLAAGSGDVNGDGITDVICATVTNVAVRRGLGGGAFAPPVTLSGAPIASRSMACLDANNDGFEDLAVLADSTLYLAAGGATGLSALLPYAIVGADLQALEAADREGDGREDLFLQAVSPTGIRALWMRNTAGWLAAPEDWGTGLLPAAGASPASLHLADPNGDGKLGLCAPVADGVLLRERLPGGLFAERLVATGQANHPLCGDLDGDGMEDVLALVTRPGFGGSAEALRQTAPGVYSGTRLAPGRIHPRGVVATDLDGDGLTDLVLSSWEGSREPWYPPFVGYIWRMMGDGTGFQMPEPFLTTAFAGRLVSADWNGDGFPDLLTADRAQYVSDGTGGYLGPDSLVLLGSQSSLRFSEPSAVNDQNGDGFPDVFVAGKYNPDGGFFSLTKGYALVSDGNRLTGPQPLSGEYSGSYLPDWGALQFGDGNGDGLIDIYNHKRDMGGGSDPILFAAAPGTPTVYSYPSAVGLTSHATLHCGGAVDFNGDGNKDYISLGEGYDGMNWVRFCVGMPIAPCVPVRSTSHMLPVAPAGSCIMVALDADADGDEDLFSLSEYNALLFVNNGTDEPDIQYLGPLAPDLGDKSNQVAIADPDGDGYPDLFVASYRYGSEDGYLGIIRNLGPHCAPPVDLAATPVGPGSVTLSWTPVPDATAYRVAVRQLPAGAPVLTATVAGPSWTPSGLSPGSDHEWTVKSVCGTIESPASAFALFTAPMFRALPAPERIGGGWRFAEGGHWRVYDVLGRLRHEGPVVEGETWRGGLPAGWYVGVFRVGDGREVRLPFVER